MRRESVTRLHSGQFYSIVPKREAKFHAIQGLGQEKGQKGGVAVSGHEQVEPCCHLNPWGGSLRLDLVLLATIKKNVMPELLRHDVFTTGGPIAMTLGVQIMATVARDLGCAAPQQIISMTGHAGLR